MFSSSSRSRRLITGLAASTLVSAAAAGSVLVGSTAAQAVTVTKTFSDAYTCNVALGGLTIKNIPIDLTASAELPRAVQDSQTEPVNADIRLDLLSESLRSAAYDLLEGRFLQKEPDPSFDRVKLDSTVFGDDGYELNFVIPVVDITVPRTAIPSEPLAEGQAWSVPATGLIEPIIVPSNAVGEEPIYMPTKFQVSASLVAADDSLVRTELTCSGPGFQELLFAKVPIEPSEDSTTPTPTTPATTAPVTTAPVTTAPATTAPVTTAPATTAPATTAPVTTAPVTTAPATTAPATTAPTTTAPATTAPATTAVPTNPCGPMPPLAGSSFFKLLSWFFCTVTRQLR